MKSDFQDPVRGETVRLTHDTGLLRRPEVYSALTRYLEEAPFAGQDVDLYWYASSCGHEPYSVALFLDQAFRQTGRHFQIHARDISPQVIEQAQTGELDLDSGDIEKYQQWFGKYLPFEQSFTPARKGYYKPGKHLQQYVTFSTGDIRLDAKKRVWGNKPVVVAFRNAWYLLNRKEQEELAQDLRDGLPKGSIVVIGGGNADLSGEIFLQRVGFKPFGMKYGDSRSMYVHNFFRQVDDPKPLPENVTSRINWIYRLIRLKPQGSRNGKN